MDNVQDFVGILKKNGINKIKENVDLKKYNTWKIGGALDVVVEVQSKNELEILITILKEIQKTFFIMGKGSNTLFPDEKIEAVGIILSGDFIKVEVLENEVIAGAGAPMAFLAMKTAKEKLTGLEFASGIPGSVGGSLVMNAGANGREMKDGLMEVTVLKENGDLYTYKREELNFAYRHSDFDGKGEIILFAKYLLEDETENAKEKLKRIKAGRHETQPYDMPCAGSVFKNPYGNFAGKLIEELGLKGFAIGGVSVSEKHANFIVNNGGAKSSDVKNLIEKVQIEVEKEKGIKLEREVRYFGKGDLITWK